MAPTVVNREVHTNNWLLYLQNMLFQNQASYYLTHAGFVGFWALSIVWSHSSGFSRTVTVFGPLKELCFGVPQNSVRDVECPRFSQLIRIHFLQMPTRIFIFPLLVKHRYEQDSHRPASNKEVQHRERKMCNVYINQRDPTLLMYDLIFHYLALHVSDYHQSIIRRIIS